MLFLEICAGIALLVLSWNLWLIGLDHRDDRHNGTASSEVNGSNLEV